VLASSNSALLPSVGSKKVRITSAKLKLAGWIGVGLARLGQGSTGMG